MNEITEDAIARLTSSVLNEPDRRISFVVGSGVSRGLVPGTEDLTARFLEELGSDAETAKAIRHLSPATAYAHVSEKLKRRTGPRRIASVIRQAILEAAPDYLSTPLGTQVPLDAWKTNPAHDAIAAFYAALPPTRRGAILTTNFDPLIEVSLERQGVPRSVLNLNDEARLNLVTPDKLVPVVHLHGHWSEGAVVNASTELDRERPELEASISDAMRGAIVWVVGYGGWEDSFARSLKKLAQGTSFSLLESEICWITHDATSVATRSDIFSIIVGTPGVTEYVEVDAATVLKRSASEVLEHKESIEADATPVGWTTVPTSGRIGEATEDDISALMDGAAATWVMAKAAPALSSSLSLREAVIVAAEVQGQTVIAAVGPTGEGKSLALRQAGIALREAWGRTEESAVWYREPGAPTLQGPWAGDSLAFKNRVGLVIDDADLILDEIVNVFSNKAEPYLVAKHFILLLGFHEHELHTARVKNALEKMNVRSVRFDGPTENDASALASFWQQRNILPEVYQNGPAQTVAEMVFEASRNPRLGKSSLFASILELWNPSELLDRVHDLMSRTARYKVNDIPLSQILLALALVDSSSHESGSLGIDLEQMSIMLGLASKDIVPLVIRPLGREAGVAFDGAFVHTRHPSIAHALVDEFEDTEVIRSAASLLGVAAGRALVQGFTQTQVPGLFSPRLSGNDKAAHAWARAMIDSSGKMLRSRVTFMSTHRRTGNLEYADKYAQKVAEHLEEFPDWKLNVRGFYCEWALTLRRLGLPARALKKVMLALSDKPYVPMFPVGISHALDRGKEAASDLAKQGVDGAFDMVEIFELLQARHERSDSGLSIPLVQLLARLKAKSARILGTDYERLTYKELIIKLSNDS